MVALAALVAAKQYLHAAGWTTSRAALLAAATLAAAFSVGFTAVAALPPLALALALVYTRTAREPVGGAPAGMRESVRAHAELWLGFALAHVFAYAVLMKAYNSPVFLLLTSCILSGLSVAPFAAAYAVSERFATRDSSYGTLVFPLFWTTCFTTWSELGPVGTWGSWAYAMSPVGANLGGLPMVDFMLAWGSSLAADIISGERHYCEADDECPLCVRGVNPSGIRRTRTITDSDHPHVLNDDEVDGNAESQDDEESQLLRPAGTADVRVLSPLHDCDEELRTGRRKWLRQAYVWVMVFLTAVIISELRDLPGTALTSGDSPDLLARISIGCAMAEADDESGPVVEKLLRTSRALATKGAKLVLWSEAAVQVATAEERQDLFRRVGEVTASHGISIAVSFLETFRSPVDGKGRNVVSVVGPDGDVILEQEKAHPVPLVESYRVRAARGGMVVRHVPGIGKVGAAVCHDLDHPSVFRHADPDLPDLVLQPASTWAGVGDRHFQMATFRAVETGVAVFRCDSKGTGGYVEGKGTVVHLHQRGVAEEPPRKGHVASFLADHVPALRRSRTVYSAVGDLWFTVALDVLAGSALLALALPTKALAGVRRARSLLARGTRGALGSLRTVDEDPPRGYRRLPERG